MKRKTELLSPAGKWEALLAAVQNGADAVYIGEKDFSARKNASNFTWDEIPQAVKYCHLRDVKVHLALNTLIFDNEFHIFKNSVEKAAECGIDALIIQDLGAAHIARAVCPDMELHASTQLTVCNAYDALALQNAGFSRVVLSRELSEKEICHIHQNTDMQLEAFIHGALCISFSGKCLMSSFIGGRSGNRGLCAQPCRQLYCYGKKKGYFLSPRDLCLADELKRMCAAGITSFKIEGRMKSPEYVATVTSVYRKYLDSLHPLEKEDEEKLKRIFVRGDGFTKAYFCEKNTPEIMNYSISNDNLSSRADEAVLKEARESFCRGVENKKIPVTASLNIKQGHTAIFSLFDGTHNAKVTGAIAEAAKTLPLEKERAQVQTAKLGQTPFFLKSFDFYTDGISTIPISELNALRREAADILCEKRIQFSPKETFDFAFPEKISSSAKQAPYIAAEITSKEQFEAVKDADRILVPIHLWEQLQVNKKCFVVLPHVILDVKELEALLSKINPEYPVYASTPGGAFLAKKLGHKVYADWSMNICNAVSIKALSKICNGFTLSPELSLSEAKAVIQTTFAECELICYGYQRVMVSRACLIRGITGKCDCHNNIKLRDKTGAEFTIMGNPETHICTVLNSRPTFMADKLGELRKISPQGIRLCFTTETNGEARKILAMHKGKCPLEKPPVYTRGYFFK